MDKGKKSNDKKLKWEDPKLVRLNEVEQANGNDYGMTQIDPPSLQ